MSKYVVQRVPIAFNTPNLETTDAENVWENFPETYSSIDRAIDYARDRIERGATDASRLRVVKVVALFDSKIVVDVKGYEPTHE